MYFIEDILLITDNKLVNLYKEIGCRPSTIIYTSMFDLIYAYALYIWQIMTIG